MAVNRVRSIMIMTGRLRRNSTQGPSGTAATAPTAKPAAASADTAAGPAWKLLGKKDLGTAEMPPVGTALVDGELAWRMHKGGHTTGPNLDTFVTWAARYIKNSSASTSSPQPLSAAANRSAPRRAKVTASSSWA